MFTWERACEMVFVWMLRTKPMVKTLAEHKELVSRWLRSFLGGGVHFRACRNLISNGFEGLSMI